MAPRPTVEDITDDFYEDLGPWQRADTMGELWDLLEFCDAPVGLLQGLEEVIRDTDDGVGWSPILDVDRAPSDWLPWLAQLAGARLEPGLSDVNQRARIKSTDGFKRGSPGAIVGAAQQYLTGTKTVYLVERHGSAYRLTVTTLASETPDLAAVQRAVADQKPAGIVLFVTTTIGGDYDALRNTHASYNNVKAIFLTYNAVAADPTDVTP
jgi:hypothetical protein